MTPAPHKLLRLSVVAQRCDVSVQTVRNWINAGKLRAERTLGGHLRVREEDAEKITLQNTPKRFES